MSNPSLISAIVIAKNEEINIQRCVESLNWCDEVIVIDDHSQDRTSELAVSSGAKVIQHSFTSFANQRNWGIEQCNVNTNWILMFDADEVSTPEFAQEVKSRIEQACDETIAFKTCRKTMFMGEWLKYSDGFPVWIMRIVKRGQPCFADSGHGEVPVPDIGGIMGTINEPFLHFPFSKGIDEWVIRHRKYAEREARKELDEDIPLRLSLLIGNKHERRSVLRNLSRKLPARSFLRFCYQYFWKWGVLDGKTGLTFVKLMAFYEGLIVMKKKELNLNLKTNSNRKMSD